MGPANNALDIGVDILSSLASPDSLRIFSECAEGIKSSTKTIVKLDLTHKRYYTWLKRLIDTGLVEKRENAYVQTMLGKLCYRLTKALSSALNERDQLELADKLMRADTFSSREKEEILRKISKSELLGIASLRDFLHEVKMVDSYEDFAAETARLIENASRSVYVAAHRTDTRVLDAIVEAAERGVKFLFLGSKELQPPEDQQALRMILSPTLIKAMQKVMSSGEMSVKLTDRLSYSFYIVDEEYGLVELSHPVQKGFCVAFEFRNEVFCRDLIETFNTLYNEGNEYPLLKYVEKYAALYK